METGKFTFYYMPTNILTMKNFLVYSVAAGLLFAFLQSCGPSEEELRRQEREREQVRLDSLEQVWQEEMAQIRRDSLEQARQQAIQETVTEVREPEPEPEVVIRYDRNGPFAVQVRSWRSEELARKQVEEWNRRGFDHVYIQKYGNEETGDV